MGKYIISVIFFIVFVFRLDARELTLGEFSQLLTDISARTHAREDFNGDKCALVKVSLPVAGCKFEGAVGDCIFDVNEYWVYMPSGAKKLRIKCPGFETLDVVFSSCSDIASLESLNTYLLKIEGYEEAAVSPNKDSGINYLIITISPKDIPGLFVIINNQPEPVEYGEAIARLEYGEYPYSVVANGYEPVKGTAIVKKGEKTKIHVEMKSIVATLTVRSMTPDASITVNGKPKGSGEWSGDLPPGNYLIEVAKDGFHTYTENIVLGKTERKSIEIPELIALSGSIAVSYKPTGSIIRLDGKEVGETPQILENVEIGYHTVEVSKSGFDGVVEEKVLVKEGEVTHLNGSLAEIKKDDQIKDNYDVPAAFPGGYSEMNQQLSQLLNIPGDTPVGKYVIPFDLSIDESGNISDIVLLESDPKLKSIESECIRVISQLPPFYPAIKDGKPIKSRLSIKIPVTVLDVTSKIITPATFPGGTDAMGKVLSENLVIPKGIKPGTYSIPFELYIDETGNVSDVKVLESRNDIRSLEKECVRVLKLLPAFNPAMQDGVAVSTTFPLNVPVTVIEELENSEDGVIQPTFPGGYEKMSEHISRNLRFPSTAPIGSFIIPLELAIDEKGKVTNVNVLDSKSTLKVIEKEIVRVMKELPSFNPATKDGMPVKSVLPINLPVNVWK